MNEVSFSRDPAKNTTVFLGDNSAGKSTLVEAFKWGLYGVDLGLDYKDDVLNKEIVNEMYSGKEESVSVEVELFHSDIRYVFKRESVYVCTDIGKVKLKDGRPVFAWVYEGGDKVGRREDSYKLVQKILPLSLAGYFFFDGENIEKLYKSKNLKDSISVLMGLEPLKMAVYHLKEVNNGFIKQCSMDITDKGSELQKDLERAQKKLEDAEEILKREEQHVESLYEYYKKAEKQFEDNKKTIEYSEKIKQIDGEIKKSSSAIDNMLVDISEIFNDTCLDLFSYDLIKHSMELLKESIDKKLIKESVPGVNEESIKSILERGRCICGSDLASNPELIENLKQELEFIPPRSIGTEIHVFNSNCKLLNKGVSRCKNDLENRYITFVDQVDNVDDLKAEHEELISKSAGLSDGEASKITKEYNSYKSQYRNKSRDLVQHNTRVVMAKKEVLKIEDDIKRVAVLDNKNKIPILCSAYTERLIAEIQDTIDRKEGIIFDEFSTRLEDVFGKMYHGKRSIALTEKYEIRQYTEVGETSMSGGTKVTLGFAFVATLLSMAREELNKEDPDIETEPYPLVMDAPTSDLDGTHIGNAFEYISDVAEQIIIMMTDKDWEHAKNALGHRMNKVYRLDKKTETHTRIIEEVQHV